MPIKYRAVHEHMPWKRVGNHRTLDGAINGERGAKKILLGRGSYAQRLWAERGRPICIFVWDDGERAGYAFRVNPVFREIQEARVPVEILEAYDKVKECSDLESLFVVPSSPTLQSSTGHAHLENVLAAMEGCVRETIVLSRGRNAALRNAALAKAEGTCETCGVDFSSILGGRGVRALQVHHRQQLALREIPSVTKLDELAVVCANCHSLIHADSEHALPVEELRTLLAAESHGA
ncbi:hypothetical protein LLG90_24315 [Aromatoleum toluclasticum]|uniref:hypothetical protein n=1 Tax=Aromatoleum toluclasticum TaxID=92003 RepID=UPI001D185055|nr:hypothetical protein [Aromatoleum toluclasticum]MCC4118487.1 hypothetical protein [Aromatoleum toluclasticum]